MSRADLYIIIDESGSMAPLREDTIGGFNTLIEDQRSLDGECDVTLVTFNRGHHRVLNRVDLKNVRPLNRGDYRPYGYTALLDAVGSVLSDIEARVGEGKVERPVEVVIITDGEENASMEYTQAAIQAKVAQLTEQGVGFTFLGANIDAFGDKGGTGLGILDGNTYAYSPTSKGVKGAYAATSSKMKMSRTGDKNKYMGEITRGLKQAAEDGTATKGYSAEEALKGL